MSDRASSPGGEPARREIALGDGAMSYLAWKGKRSIGRRPPLLFMHATGFNAVTYRTLLGPLAARFRLFAVDMRGHGLTSLPAEPARMAEWDNHRDDVLVFLQRLLVAEEIEPPLLLAGHSLGASVSALAAAARPDLVAGLVLIEPVVMPYFYHWWLWVARRLGLRHRASRLVDMAARRRAVFDSREAMLAAYRGRGAFATWPEAMLRDYIEGGTRAGPDGQVELTCAPAWEAANFRAQAPYLWRRIARIRCPITVMRGTIESTCPGPVAARIVRLQPRTRMVVVEGATHFVPMERPELVRAELLDMGARLFAGGDLVPA